MKLLYANRHDIRIISTNQSDQKETTIVDTLEDAIALDFDYSEGLVFWADVGQQKIERVRISQEKSGEIEDVISFGLKKPEGLAVDWVGKKLYWTDCSDSDWETNRIEVANFNGSDRKVLFWKDLDFPRAIAVDPLKGYVKPGFLIKMPF